LTTVCVILAAGRSERMGAQKLLLPFGTTTLLGRALEAASDFSIVVVVAPALVAHVTARPNQTVIVNDAPERGMAHSLAMADAAIADRGAALAVLLGDTPLVDAALVRRMVAARGDADVAYPVRGGIAGHPVIFGPSVRPELARLAAGDTLRSLRDDPSRRRSEVHIDEEAPYLDVDTPQDLARAHATLARIMEPGARNAPF